MQLFNRIFHRPKPVKCSYEYCTAIATMWCKHCNAYACDSHSGPSPKNENWDAKPEYCQRCLWLAEDLIDAIQDGDQREEARMRHALAACKA